MDHIPTNTTVPQNKRNRKKNTNTAASDTYEWKEAPQGGRQGTGGRGGRHGTGGRGGRHKEKEQYELMIIEETKGQKGCVGCLREAESRCKYVQLYYKQRPHHWKDRPLV